VSIELGQKTREGRPLYVVIPLLLLNLTLLSIQIQDPSGTLLVRRWVMGAGAPLLNVSSGVVGGLSHAWRSYAWLSGARQENQRLHETLQQFALRDRALEQVRQENTRLRRLLSLEAASGFRTIGARVVARTPAFLSNVLYIDRGTADGVRADSPVVSGSGIIGRVVLVTPHDAQVQLLTNVDASVGVMIEYTRSPGVAKGSGEPLLDLDYIANTEEVSIGDQVVTSGLDKVFPKGLPVGKVVESRKGKTVFRTIVVEPAADLLRIEEVLVILGQNEVPETTTAPGGQSKAPEIPPPSAQRRAIN
jgi:rod shape-determining protein MreC